MPRHLGGTLEREDTSCEPADLLRERAASEAAARRFAFLAEASVALATSLDYETTLQRVARLALPEMADWCVVDTLEDGAIRLLAVAHVEPAREALVHELR